MTQLGLMPKLADAGRRPARRALAGSTTSPRKTGAAAEQVCSISSIRPRSSMSYIAAEARRTRAEALADAASCAMPRRRGDALSSATSKRATERVDQHLTDIMIAQDFHDLTGQVVAKVVTLAGDIEDQLAQAADPDGAGGPGAPVSIRRCCTARWSTPQAASDAVEQPGAGRRPARQPGFLSAAPAASRGRRRSESHRLATNLRISVMLYARSVCVRTLPSAAVFSASVI